MLFLNNLRCQWLSILLLSWPALLNPALCPSAEPVRRTWMIEGVQREALLFVPENAAREPSPLVFVFHGHGGTMRNAAQMFQYHRHWPEAISVCMQGLRTPGQLTDPEGKKPGWQKSAGDQNDRDLKFFDAVLTDLRTELKVDDRRIYSTGHSNGGGFTYLLWAERGGVFAAMAPSGSAALRSQSKLHPKPMMHIAGRNDPLVRFEWQQSMMDAVLKLNSCGEGRKISEFETHYDSSTANPVVTYITNQGHRFPAASVPRSVLFFKSQSQPAVQPPQKHP